MYVSSLCYYIYLLLLNTDCLYIYNNSFLYFLILDVSINYLLNPILNYIYSNDYIFSKILFYIMLNIC